MEIVFIAKWKYFSSKEKGIILLTILSVWSITVKMYVIECLVLISSRIRVINVQIAAGPCFRLSDTVANVT